MMCIQCNCRTGGQGMWFPREDHFMITVASEIMAVLCLAKDLEDLKRVLVASSSAQILKVNQCMYINSDVKVRWHFMKDAIKPNLVQTLEHACHCSWRSICQYCTWL